MPNLPHVATFSWRVPGAKRLNATLPKYPASGASSWPRRLHPPPRGFSSCSSQTDFPARYVRTAPPRWQRRKLQASWGPGPRSKTTPYPLRSVGQGVSQPSSGGRNGPSMDGSCSKGGCMQAWVGYVTTKQSSTWGLLGGEEQGTCIISNLDIG